MKHRIAGAAAACVLLLVGCGSEQLAAQTVTATAMVTTTDVPTATMTVTTTAPTTIALTKITLVPVTEQVIMSETKTATKTVTIDPVAESRSTAAAASKSAAEAAKLKGERGLAAQAKMAGVDLTYQALSPADICDFLRKGNPVSELYGLNRRQPTSPT